MSLQIETTAYAPSVRVHVKLNTSEVRVNDLGAEVAVDYVNATVTFGDAVKWSWNGAAWKIRKDGTPGLQRRTLRWEPPDKLPQSIQEAILAAAQTEVAKAANR